MSSRKNKGFTLIELLVVVAIISLLSSIVMVSLNGARGKAKNSAIKAELKQLQTLAIFNYDDYGTYTNLQPGTLWFDTNAECDAAFLGNHALQARAICKNLVSLTAPATSNLNFFAGVQSASPQQFSFMAFLPNTGRWACVGSSGAFSDIDVSNWTSLGCWSNP